MLKHRKVSEYYETDCKLEKPIKPEKLVTFETESDKQKIGTRDGNVFMACFVTGLFGGILSLSLE